MAVFRYRLQNVLDIKIRMEEQAKAGFAAANTKLLEEEEKLQNLLDRRDEYESEGRKLREAVLNVNELRENTRALDNLKEQIEIQKKEVTKAQSLVETARRRLTDAMQERKIHDKLKENSFEEFVREINAAESKEIDELVSYTYGERIKKEEKLNG